jgi:hypothetical protein
MRTQRRADYKSNEAEIFRTYPRTVSEEKPALKGESKEPTRKTTSVEGLNFNDLGGGGILTSPHNTLIFSEGGRRGKTNSSPDHRRRRSTPHPRELTISHP